MQLNPSEISELIKSKIENLATSAEAKTQGTVVSVTDGICRVHGLSDVMQGEMLEFPGNTFGLALNLERDSVGAVVLGPILLKFIIKLVRHLDIGEAKLFISFLFVMALAWLANLAGLATIVGAFTAGLIMQDAYFSHWGPEREHTVCIKDLIMPIEAILVPIFFVLMGIQVKLETFMDTQVLILSAGLLVAAIAGKLLAGLGAARGNNRWAVGIGMLPRGEVGLIFAAIGKSLGVIGDALFSAIVLMVVLTTLLAPPLLKYTLQRPSGRTE